ncbi:MAG: nucleotidyltransferase domain-containing protein [Candidatus Aenigmarchaeota archaeon]|nr:nucleotidyltransferase domain-containing protein [Candidatus Aenigmarchaeota archaeon]
MQKQVEMIKKAVEKDKSISFAYVFGSVARGKAGALSDIDVAVFIRNGTLKKCKAIKNISGFKGRHIDVVVLNDAPLLMQFNVIKEGIVIKNSAERTDFEYVTMRNFLDEEYHERLQARVGLARIAKKGLV